MCSNYQPIKRSNNPWVKNHFGVDLPDADWKGHVWPTDKAPFIYIDEGKIKCGLGKFGMVPGWVKDKDKTTYGRNTYNARNETITERPSFRSSWKAGRFCLVLAEQFFEPFYQTPESKSSWAAIKRTDNEPVAIGSIWESYFDDTTGEIVYSFSMITLNADEHEFMRQFHEWGKEKRSVVIVETQNFTDWLEASQDAAKGLIKLSSSGYLQKNQ